MPKAITNYRQINTKNFSSVLDGMVSRDGTQREQLQAFLVFAINHAMENSSAFDYLNRVVEAAQAMSMVPYTQVDKFIRHCIEGISRVENANKTAKVYKKITKKTKVKYRYTSADSIPNWFEWSENGKPKATAAYTVEKFQAYVKRAAKRLHDEAGVNSGQFSDTLSELAAQSGEIFVNFEEETGKEKAA